MPCEVNYECSKESEGTLLLPILNESEWSEAVRIIFYLVALVWSFTGVAIIADVFMCAIETITSKVKIIKVAKPGAANDFEEVEVRVWNDTVANLTLMALGSSAPEILLSIIEIIGTNFEAGKLGPSTIVGSAAFNLLVITGVCVMAIPNGEVRTIKSLKVFAVTAVCSVMAYVWLVIILKVSSENVVDLWEAIFTFLLFPMLVIVAYMADKELGCSSSGVRPSQDIGMLELAEGSQVLEPSKDPEIMAFIKELNQNNQLTEEDQAKLVAMRIQAKTPKNYGYYRVGALRGIGGGKKLTPSMNTHLHETYDELSEVQFSSDALSHIRSSESEPPKTFVEFASPQYAVLESSKIVKIAIIRTGNTKIPAVVNFETIDGTAMAQSDYIAKKDSLVFKPDETIKHVTIEIVDDNEWEEDEVFFVKLSCYDASDKQVQIGHQSITEVTIINDDEPGVISFQKPSYVVKESIGKASLVLERTKGTDGTVSVTWTTKDQSATEGKDYVGGTGTVVFEHAEQIKTIDIAINDDKEFEKDESFIIELKNPTGGATLGRLQKTIVTIVNDDEYKRVFDRVVGLTHLNLNRMKLGSETWGQQFRNAMSVNGGDVENATSMDYFMHFITFPWKVIFALCPPCTWLGGWLAFCVALGMIGILTAVVGDLATIFGCLVGLKKEVTAITFVAMGTSLPDLFASKTAATAEKHADASVGNVTGSNSVNVFLGLGTPWVIAAAYWHAKDKVFVVEAGTLTISVIVYAVCATICLAFLVLRRRVSAFGNAELGGPNKAKYITGVFFISLWFVYIIISSLVSYDVLDVKI
ncbi:sodium/calcium exchanger 3-like [Dendronephthya gigantea]|uniref:sodium/calcium exchanger 3-like n=1 Tax=Dendronephthya gigantea TaxID=151771 RepID=UPI00106A6B79|nr:sodium/calcium exchanger 3-like [Dendronephthya gigantea]